MDKNERHLLIKEIVEQQEIETQFQLMDELKKRGVVLTQATVSRDIKELNMIKVLNDNGRVSYAIVSSDEESNDNYLKEVLLTYARKLTQVSFINVIRTDIGTADVIAAEIDEKNLPEIIGTLAGTDTIALISKSVEDATKINQRLSSYIDKH